MALYINAELVPIAIREFISALLFFRAAQNPL